MSDLNWINAPGASIDVVPTSQVDGDDDTEAEDGYGPISLLIQNSMDDIGVVIHGTAVELRALARTIAESLSDIDR